MILYCVFFPIFVFSPLLRFVRYPAHPFVSRVYLYTFICLFIYAVLNIFVAIVEDAFFASKAFQLHGQPELEDKERADQVRGRTRLMLFCP
mgnify:CR=1 FL=1